jgi:hypothetical protein
MANFDPFISTADLEAFLGATLADPNVLIVKIALDSACTAVRSYLDQDINKVTADIEYHSGHGWLHDRIRLRQRPVVSVTSVYDYDVLLDPANYNVRDAFLVLTDGSYFVAGNDNIQVTYTHGYEIPATSQSEAVPADIRLVALSAARRVYVSTGQSDLINKRGEKIGDYEYTYGYTGSKTGQVATSAAELITAEKDVLDRYRVYLVP